MAAANWPRNGNPTSNQNSLFWSWGTLLAKHPIRSMLQLEFWSGAEKK